MKGRDEGLTCGGLIWSLGIGMTAVVTVEMFGSLSNPVKDGELNGFVLDELSHHPEVH